MSKEFLHEVIYIFVSEINVKSEEGKRYFPKNILKNKLMRAVRVSSFEDETKKFYKVIIEQEENPNKIIGFIVRDLVFENENIYINAEEVKIEDLADYNNIESEDYIVISKWEKTGNLDLYKRLFKETSDAIANSICPYFLFPSDLSDIEEEYEEIEDEEYIKEKVKEALDEMLVHKEDFLMYEILKKVKEINSLDKNKLSAIYNMIMYL
jgi:hypothetical protein